MGSFGFGYRFLLKNLRKKQKLLAEHSIGLKINFFFLFFSHVNFLLF